MTGKKIIVIGKDTENVVRELKAAYPEFEVKSAHHTETEIAAGDFRLDKIERTILYEHSSIPLTKNEFLIILALMEQPGKVVTKNELHKVLKGEEKRKSNLVDVYINYIRKKLPEGAIMTVHGEGYKLAGM